MLTDRAPVDYRYLSRRLLTDLVQHDESSVSARRGWRSTVGFSLFGFNIQVQRQRPDLNNMHELAERSLTLVSDNCAGLGRPAEYIHDELDLQRGVFPILAGWHGEIACFASEVQTEMDGRIFLALFGSVRNLTSRREAEDSLPFHPSDGDGLYALLNEVRERQDPEVHHDYLWEDYRHSPEGRAETAIMFARGGTDGPAERLEFLARIFTTAYDYERHTDRYDQVVIGSPLWVATPRPQSLRADGSPQRRGPATDPS